MMGIHPLISIRSSIILKLQSPKSSVFLCIGTFYRYNLYFKYVTHLVSLPVTSIFLQQTYTRHKFIVFLPVQKLLRRLRNESPYVEEIMDVKESLYKQLLEMFEKWKVRFSLPEKRNETVSVPNHAMQPGNVNTKCPINIL